jgi:hypothetical protein
MLIILRGTLTFVSGYNYVLCACTLVNDAAHRLAGLVVTGAVGDLSW